MGHCLFECVEALKGAVVLLFSWLFGGMDCLCCGRERCRGLPLCAACRERLLHGFAVDPAHRCRVCGKPLISEQGICMDCRTERVIICADSVLPLFPYRLWARTMLLAWKLEGERLLSAVYAAAVNNAIRVRFATDSLPAIVPVPPRPGKIREKGWDQIEDLCRYLRYRYGFTVLRLLRRFSRDEQKKKGRRERLDARGAGYGLSAAGWRSLARGRLPPQVLLLDDVITTGATVARCSALLKGCGIRKVHVLSLFIVD